MSEMLFAEAPVLTSSNSWNSLASYSPSVPEPQPERLQYPHRRLLLNSYNPPRVSSPTPTLSPTGIPHPLHPVTFHLMKGSAAEQKPQPPPTLFPRLSTSPVGPASVSTCLLHGFPIQPLFMCAVPATGQVPMTPCWMVATALHHLSCLSSLWTLTVS